MTNRGLRTQARVRAGTFYIAPHSVRSLAGVVMELIVKLRVEQRVARADTPQPRVLSCKSPPVPTTLAEITPLNLGKTFRPAWAERKRALTFSSDEREKVPRSHKQVIPGWELYR
jgi:hypothetical protein